VFTVPPLVLTVRSPLSDGSGTVDGAYRRSYPV